MILTGWKEISKYLRFGVRTVQRWESHGLPVKRINKTPRSPVVADSEELDAWILHRIELPPGVPRTVADNLQRARELRHESEEIRRELQARLEVLRKTLDVSRAFWSPEVQQGFRDRERSIRSRAELRRSRS